MKGIRKISISKYDRQWGKMVRERDKKCVVCGSTSNLQAHHLFPRARNGTRFVLLNGHSLCPVHHVFSYEFSAHKTPEKFRKWAQKHLGTKVFKSLEKQSLDPTNTRAKAIKQFLTTL